MSPTFNQRRLSLKKVNKYHVPFGVPWFISFETMTESTIYNDQYNFNEKYVYLPGKWKLILTKKDDKFHLIKDRYERI